MPDIAMCLKENNKCKLKKSCYRYIAKPDSLQSYSDFYANKTQEKCDFYWEVKTKKTKRS
jgi:hypothetical protein